ncbi:MAG TPA: cytidine deaminase [Bacteroidia bacterium]|nr:cytidine deaminase [Bacteroidia bacterium]
MRKSVRKEVTAEAMLPEELSKEQQQALTIAKALLPNAYAPYSHFKVAAVAILEDGTVISGTNQENAAYPSGLCAERVALFHAGSIYPHKKVTRLVVTALGQHNSPDGPVSPCGACLQVMSETEYRQGETFEIILSGATGDVLVTNGVSNFLPFRFTPEQLKK